MGKRAKPEEIIAKLREVEVRLSQGETIAQAVRAIGVTEQTFYRWRKEYGGLRVGQAKRMKEIEKENARLRRAVSDLTLDNQILKEVVRGKLLSPSRKRVAVDHVVEELGVSVRRACRVVGQHRSTQRREKTPRHDEGALTAAIISLAERFGRYGYRRITALLREAGWSVSTGRVYRIWRREGLKVPQKQPKRGRLWLNDGSCVRLRPAHKGHVWSYDFVQDRTHDGKVFRMLCVIDEFTRECLAIRVERRLNSRDVLDTLGELFLEHGPPEHIRSDNGPEFIATALREWLQALDVRTLYIEPGSPWENGYCESFNSKLRDELLAREIFYDLREAQVLIENWRLFYNTARPHSSLGYKPPAPRTILPATFMPPYRLEAA
ncbi:MAG TPA: IS3 family transposase [Hyphomonas sp.]|uniref:IS3 family transposase n=2 Tax=unclassified Hyphomonas TaxID=2630699 RepID=UPI000C91E45F|nr:MULTISPECIES: IS3 family transposase [unclassified Hyphomonas]MAL46481.1 IS3 family transposase [Hyphomonas sp.]HBN93097.1 IS3 family transposase [Hyphomonas sp.]HBT36722.1 IS3 family transposase [Hyphomonas sp.]HBU35398.1 IS3 family transposase [Hyphomonas sp.]HBX92922.1 IS3 family transposase [Hyphomonas sp.]